MTDKIDPLLPYMCTNKIINITSLPIKIWNNKDDALLPYYRLYYHVDESLLNDLFEKIRTCDVNIVQQFTMLAQFLKEWFTIGKKHTFYHTITIHGYLISTAEKGYWLDDSFKTYFGHDLKDYVINEFCGIIVDIDGNIILK